MAVRGQHCRCTTTHYLATPESGGLIANFKDVLRSKFFTSFESLAESLSEDEQK